MVSKNNYNKIITSFKRSACVGDRELHLVTLYYKSFIQYGKNQENMEKIKKRYMN